MWEVDRSSANAQPSLRDATGQGAHAQSQLPVMSRWHRTHAAPAHTAPAAVMP